MVEVVNDTTPEEWFSFFDTGNRLDPQKFPLFVNNRFWKVTAIHRPRDTFEVMIYYFKGPYADPPELFKTIRRFNRPKNMRLIRVGEFGCFTESREPVSLDADLPARSVYFQRKIWRWPDGTEHSSYELTDDTIGLNEDGELICLLER